MHVLKISENCRRSQCYAIKFESDSAQFYIYIYIFLTLKQRNSVFERVNRGVIAISYYEKTFQRGHCIKEIALENDFFLLKMTKF